MLNSVKEFHKAFRLVQKETPAFISEIDYEMRYKLMKEENEEYLQACQEKNLVEIADALGDKLYVLLGTILSHGMYEIIYPVFEEIHKSNMTKLDINGNPIYREDGKVTKSNLYKKPDIATIVENPDMWQREKKSMSANVIYRKGEFIKWKLEQDVIKLEEFNIPRK